MVEDARGGENQSHPFDSLLHLLSALHTDPREVYSNVHMINYAALAHT